MPFHNNKTQIRLLSSVKKTISSLSHATISIIAGGRQIDKPLLKARHAYYKYKAKRYKCELLSFSPLCLQLNA